MTASRHRLLAAGFRAIAATGADRWLRPLARGAGVILTFHHVRPEPPGAYAPNRLLTITPDFLDRVLVRLEAEGFAIVGLDAVPERLAAGGGPFAVLTFDDGYRDTRDHAAPVLARHGAPWTLFVTSDFADGRGRLWWIELERAIARLDRVRLAGDDRDATGLDLPARNADEKTAAFEAVYRRLRAGPEDRLLDRIAALCAEAGIAAGSAAGDLCLSWPELSRLSEDPAVTVGAHTVSHPMLAKHPERRAAFEIGEGRDRIAARLGRPVRHLSYPVGDRTSAGGREFAIARDLGFATAVTTRPGHLFAGHARHLHALPRVSVNGWHQNEAALQALLSGVPFLAWNRGRRLDVT
ncbi:polysaccharide deacetylase [Methylobacterium sp. Leaf399]|uniref:polysaccharide deacetylase family protein n=1 Tax=unclassified Methylobacterium TaxID=2615210 RepID=UPI0006F9C746|nr:MULTISPECIES: polysaccharide deacetylase family protein [unclassified Methylobacterium]KQP50880.1 polysaccharide deacetylase [Methylobacterium sp. Leaf108]KQT07865.1 polysaccharide deacetylase [Methylobacterium sp. Leaf399]KQT88977.1 polysaccharide deacetylase [Methylobacterium sp. Leaf466]